MPVYRGTEYVADTLHSVLRQTHRDVRVMISVDGNDLESAETCRPFLEDARVRMTVQPEQLGWVGNMNWLIEACDGDFFCYWQQDDLCEPEYLERLVEALEARPAAACAYSDLRWFGRSSHKVSTPAIIGFTQQRILAQIDALHWLPLRGLVPTDVLRRIGSVRGVHDTITFSDYLWVLRLVAAGDLVRVPELLYHKRDHADSASKTRSSSYHVSPREAWIAFGVAIFREVRGAFDEADHAKLALVIADRLVTHRPDRWFHYDAASVSSAEPAAVVLDLFREIESEAGTRLSGVDRRQDAAGSLEVMAQAVAPVESTATEVAGKALLSTDRRALVALLRRRGSLDLECSKEGSADTLLLSGWASPEDWGTWSDGYEAALWLPLPGDGLRWQIRLVGQPFLTETLSPSTRRLIVSCDEALLLDCEIGAEGLVPPFELGGRPSESLGTVLRLNLPDATSPVASGLGEDQRLLSLGLERVEIRRVLK